MLDLDFDLNGFCGKTDEELAALAVNDKAACEALILRYLKLIFIKSEIYAKPDSERDDLRQEGLMGLLKAINSYDPDRGAGFSTFAEVCIVNQMRSFCAKSRKGPESCQSLDEVPDDSLSELQDPESIYISREFFSELWNAVDTVLSSTEKQVFTLVIQGVSYRETAERLGISEKSVDNAVQRARRKIRSYLSKETD